MSEPEAVRPPQILACLLLRARLMLTYRDTSDLLAASDGLRESRAVIMASRADSWPCPTRMTR